MALPALDLGEVGVGATVHHHLVQHLVDVAGVGELVAGPDDLAVQPHPQRDVHPLQNVTSNKSHYFQ